MSGYKTQTYRCTSCGNWSSRHAYVVRGNPGHLFDAAVMCPCGQYSRATGDWRGTPDWLNVVAYDAITTVKSWRAKAKVLDHELEKKWWIKHEPVFLQMAMGYERDSERAIAQAADKEYEEYYLLTDKRGGHNGLGRR